MPRPRKTETKAGGNDRRVHLGFRVTPEMKARLEGLARLSGRSQSQEAEIRLERSFEREEMLTEILKLAFGRELGGLVLAVAQVMEAAGRQPAIPMPEKLDLQDEQHVAAIYAHMNRPRGRRWIDDPQGYDQAVRAATALLDRLRPEGKSLTCSTSSDGAPERIAGALVDAIKGHAAEPVDWPRDYTPEIRELIAETPIAARVAPKRRKGKS